MTIEGQTDGQSTIIKPIVGKREAELLRRVWVEGGLQGGAGNHHRRKTKRAPDLNELIS